MQKLLSSINWLTVARIPFSPSLHNLLMENKFERTNSLLQTHGDDGVPFPERRKSECKISYGLIPSRSNFEFWRANIRCLLRPYLGWWGTCTIVQSVGNSSWKKYNFHRLLLSLDFDSVCLINKIRRRYSSLCFLGGHSISRNISHTQLLPLIYFCNRKCSHNI